MSAFTYTGNAQPEGCNCGRDAIQVLDVNGAVALQFIRIRDSYYGGAWSDAYRDLYYGAHCWLTLGAMLDLVAKLADHDKPFHWPWNYEISRSGGTVWERLPLSRHMDAVRLAKALGCTEQQVRDHFGVVVKVA